MFASSMFVRYEGGANEKSGISCHKSDTSPGHSMRSGKGPGSSPPLAHQVAVLARDARVGEQRREAAPVVAVELVRRVVRVEDGEEVG